MVDVFMAKIMRDVKNILKCHCKTQLS